jgi:hypothetical protein
LHQIRLVSIVGWYSVVFGWFANEKLAIFRVNWLLESANFSENGPPEHRNTKKWKHWSNHYFKSTKTWISQLESCGPDLNKLVWKEHKLTCNHILIRKLNNTTLKKLWYYRCIKLKFQGFEKTHIHSLSYKHKQVKKNNQCEQHAFTSKCFHDKSIFQMAIIHENSWSIFCMYFSSPRVPLEVQTLIIQIES